MDEIDDAIGRGHGDMRTPLNLQSLSDEGLAVRLPEGTWALTPQGIAWLEQIASSPTAEGPARQQEELQ